MTFEVMIKKISPTLRRITGRLNVHGVFFDEDDLYQEALLHLWKAHSEGVIADKTESYILQGCYFHLKNHLRGFRERYTAVSFSDPLGDEGIVLEEIISSEGTEALENLEARLHVESVLGDSRLTDREKVVLRLLLEGMTVREVGEDMDISHVMVVKLKAQIAKKISSAWKEHPLFLEWYRHGEPARMEGNMRGMRNKPVRPPAREDDDEIETMPLRACG